MNGVSWYDNGDIESAVSEGAQRRKPLLVDFWSPTCTGCAKLLATTYQDPRIISLLNEKLVCVKYNTTKPNEWFKRLSGNHVHMWHPHIVIMDCHLIASRRIIGYLRPDEFAANILTGVGILQLFARDFAAAFATFESIAVNYVETAVAPEALYWAGVAAYRIDGFAALTEWWDRLSKAFPRSDWTERADCLDVKIPDEGFNPDELTTVVLTEHVVR